MPQIINDNETCFPKCYSADENGIVAVGGRPTAKLLLGAYQSGVFPWPHDDMPLLWFCPDPRFVIKPTDIVINRSLQKAMRQSKLVIKADTNFLAVMKKCQTSKRSQQDGTWITNEMISGYCELYRMGLAHSIEAYDGEKLVGGLYGISLGTIFFGESMFFEQDNASKICFATLAAHLVDWNFSLIDCQAHTTHLEKFGAYSIARTDFLHLIDQNSQRKNKLGPWKLEFSPAQAARML